MKSNHEINRRRFIGTVASVTAGVTLLFFTDNIHAAGWKAEVSKANITPQENMWLTGYATRDHASEGVSSQNLPVYTENEDEEERYILTPPPSPAPRINGAKIVGASANKPFLFTVAATGNRPMLFEAAGLPEGLSLDKEKGIISGSCRYNGKYPVAVTATNSLGICRDTIEIVIGGDLALTPHMGWNSWYVHAGNVTQEIMEKSAQAMYDEGLVNFGYTYVNIDDGWAIKPENDDPAVGASRNPDGTIRPNKNFPDMKSLTAYIHHLGLKAGLYSSPGPATCEELEGSYGHESLDVKTYADWGFDFLKYDWCRYSRIVKSRDDLNELQKPYRLIGKLIREADRDMILNMCQYGMGDVWKWGKEVGGHSWRTTGDMGFYSKDLYAKMFRIGFFQEQLKDYSGPGGWNDPDYLLFGNIFDPVTKMIRPSPYTPSEQYTCMTLWCMMSAPLIFSGDMTSLDDFTKNILCNAEVIDVNQDKLGKQGYSIYNRDSIEIWKKELADGNTIIAIFNKQTADTVVNINWKELGYNNDFHVRDVWRQIDMGSISEIKSFDIPRHGCVMLKVNKKCVILHR